MAGRKRESTSAIIEGFGREEKVRLLLRRRVSTRMSEVESG